MNQEEIELILKALTTPPPPKLDIEYRLYYDKHGKPICYSTEDLPHNYIIVSRQEYAAAREDAIVVDGAMIHNNRSTLLYKLTKSLTGGVKTSKYDINIITRKNYTLWDYTAHEIH